MKKEYFHSSMLGHFPAQTNFKFQSSSKKVSPPKDLKVINPPTAHTNTHTHKVTFKVIFKSQILASLCHITKDEISQKHSTNTAT